MIDQQMNLLHQYFNRKTIVITGASGFLGSKLIEALSSFSCQIIGVSRKTADQLPSKSKLTWVRWPSEANQWKEILSHTDILFHLAAQTSMELANRDPKEDFKSNVLPVLTMLSAIHDLQRQIDLVFTSTASIYGCPSRLPVDESFPDQPMTTYCLHKKIVEDYLHTAVQQKTISGISLRLSNIYGPGVDTSAPDRSILNKMISLASEGKPIEVFDLGSEIRDYIFIDDAIKALMLAAKYCREAQVRVYVLGSGTGSSILSTVQMITRIASQLDFPKSPIMHKTPPNPLAINQRNFVANSQRFMTLTGWKARTDLAAGLQQTFYAINTKVPA